MKAKTTDKTTREVLKKKLQFRADSVGKTVGSALSCDLHVADPNVSAVHLCVNLSEDGQVYLHSLGRTYVLVGEWPPAVAVPCVCVLRAVVAPHPPPACAHPRGSCPCTCVLRSVRAGLCGAPGSVRIHVPITHVRRPRREVKRAAAAGQG